MCGIVGYIGKRDAAPLLVNGLKRLEYLGYDSAGIAVQNGKMTVLKQIGDVGGLEKAVAEKRAVFDGASIGIAHTRMATHGDPSTRNTHPHMNVIGDIALIHNGMIDNYGAIKNDLTLHGYTFRSETDSEVLVHLIDRVWRDEPMLDLESAVRMALHYIEGSYGICVISLRDPDKMVVVRNGSPLIIGFGDGEFFIASDPASIVEHTRRVICLSDGEMAVLSRQNCIVKTIENLELDKKITEIDFNLEVIGKGGFEHFMLKEIYEQPEVIKNVMQGRVLLEEGLIHLGGIEEYFGRLKQAKRVIICACGTSWHSALIGEYLIEEFARIPVEVEYASEFRCRNPVLSIDDVVIVISQSGETADTLAALRQAKERGAMVLGICNVVESTIARETICGIYTNAGPEVGVASTKTFTAQVTVLHMLALALSKGRSISHNDLAYNLKELASVPEKIARILELNEQIKSIAETINAARNMLFLGRGYNFPVALEGALKMKEISCIHAEGYPAAEMKHGPIALIDENVPVVFIASKDNSYTKVLSNIEEVRSRHGRVIAIANEGDKEVGRLAEQVIYIPQSSAPIAPLLTVIPLQLLAYHIAFQLRSKVGRPRNHAKSVMIERCRLQKYKHARGACRL
jgi:glucosamine--fructose-6-phosphate aminotransferase (isomerizing)